MTRSQRARAEVKSSRRQLQQRFEESPLRLSEAATHNLLNKLCVDLGYCLPPESIDRLVSDPPTDPSGFASLVMELEGVGAGDTAFFEPVLDRVCKAFLQEAGNDA
jgi:hypothetical protein